jgi:hypothetical protein
VEAQVSCSNPGAAVRLVAQVGVSSCLLGDTRPAHRTEEAKCMGRRCGKLGTWRALMWADVIFRILESVFGVVEIVYSYLVCSASCLQFPVFCFVDPLPCFRTLETFDTDKCQLERVSFPPFIYVDFAISSTSRIRSPGFVWVLRQLMLAHLDTPLVRYCLPRYITGQCHRLRIAGYRSRISASLLGGQFLLSNDKLTMHPSLSRALS